MLNDVANVALGSGREGIEGRKDSPRASRMGGRGNGISKLAEGEREGGRWNEGRGKGSTQSASPA